ncbi:hypothetical protein [Streptomyces sp. NPDC047028]|uniref:hypothetical protein n=1 Tax=Streptomyces sp. NPDC047028 TaxID=3155793 RepID=UPI0033D94C1D
MSGPPDPGYDLKIKLRKALALCKDELGADATYSDILAYVKGHQARFKDIFKAMPKDKEIKSFRGDIAKEEKIPSSFTSSLDSVKARLGNLKSGVAVDAMFVWTGDFPGKGGLYVVDRSKKVYAAFPGSCDQVPKPGGLTDSSDVHLLDKKPGKIELTTATLKYADVGKYLTPQEQKAQADRQAAELLEQQRYQAYLQGNAVWRNPVDGALMYRNAAVTFLGQAVTVTGAGQVRAGGDLLYRGRLEQDNPLVIDVYTEVVASATLVLAPQRSVHKRDGVGFSRARAAAGRVDPDYYADVLVERLRQSLAPRGNLGPRSLIINLTPYISGFRHLTVIAPPGGAFSDQIHTAMSGALAAGTSPGAALAALCTNWHVSVERTWDSNDNIQATPGYVNPLVRGQGQAFYDQLGRPSCAAIIGTHGNLLTAGQLETRIGY